jgi:acetate kinase
VREIVPSARRIISCHLGGSSSISAILDGKSMGNSLGLTPQTGLPHNNRVGDFDTFALLKLLKHGYTVEDVLKKLGKEGGLLGISGVSNDMRDIEKAAAEGNARARLAIDAFVESARHYIGAYLVALGGCDVLSFTGGIGENGREIRKAICSGLAFAGIELDDKLNDARGKETRISSAGTAQVWIVPTNEELIVARQTVEALNA